MTDNTAVLYKQILDASYNIYVDVNGINAAMARASSIMGLQQKPAPTLPSKTEEIVKQTEPSAPARPAVQSEPKKEETPAKRTQEYHPIGRERDIQIEMQPGAAGLKEKKAEGPKLSINAKPFKPQKLPEVEMQKVELPRVVSPAKTETEEQKAARIAEMEKIVIAGPKIQTPVTSINMENVPQISIVRSNENLVSSLLNLVKSKGSITISDAASQLHASRALVERWAKILSQSSLLRIKYQMIGDTVMEA